LVTSGTAKGEMAIDNVKPTGEQDVRSLRLTITQAGPGRVGIANDGYWGIPVKQGQSYDLSLKARADAGFNGPLIASLESQDGKVYAQKQIRGLTLDWKWFHLTLTPETSAPDARLLICSLTPGTVWFDMASLFPRDTWKRRANGLRPDLAEMLRGLQPAFVRFPGGCWVEGDTLKFSYHWKQTVGELSERRTQYNIWQYYSTHGLGYHEYLRLCEDLRAEPLFVINCGMSHKENVPMDQLGPWVQDALDAIEYANGGPDTTWGGLRVRNGHHAPFNLKYMEIGNENGGPAYHQRYAAFYQAIKAKYPEMHLLADERPGTNPVEIIDEHYYSSPRFFIQNAGRYDTYDRRGPKVYVGEYAVTEGCGQGNLRGALGEAAFMTGLERNSDVVLMASYAPLFANVNYKKWNPDLINFNGSVVYGTPSYYVQKLFAENRGDQVLPTRLEVPESEPEPRHGAVGVGTWETQAEYKDLKVTQGDKVLYEFQPSDGTTAWKRLSGDWHLKDGALQQTAGGSNRRVIVGDAAWTDYTLSLKARKLGGAEGFLILFHVQDENNWLWWNIGGWGNTKHAIEQSLDGGKAILGRDVSAQIETGRWYDVRIELAGDRIRCFLDRELIHDVKDTRRLQPLHVVASRSDRNGEIILKAVNVADRGYETDITLQGARQVRPAGRVITLTSDNPTEENSIAQPAKVVPVESALANAASQFKYTFPANSLTVLRLKAQ
jgi:alpha-L-arabinofuranosidase